MRNVALGGGALKKRTTGRDNLALGTQPGSVPVTGFTNIHIGNAGILGDTPDIRPGSMLLKAFIAGIHGATVSRAFRWWQNLAHGLIPCQVPAPITGSVMRASFSIVACRTERTGCVTHLGLAWR
jgi:hypothetical protein